ncbi:hypothetical protein OB236_23895 [Paenibacillus sp. WQ 127069]|uniref:Uncharacterized protein n=1 Tax=Paenibacillus baimaensis TaxID=2982185 RepID=A0ABT2UKI3_9BACL|nr:hypothetical protein [Paenibacillus sp. WQ 127069]MCU6795154.1 hypothetical protein [Paenibacillus sp. WQ 127069]
MFKPNQPLTCDFHLQTAQNYTVPVSVWMQGEMLAYRGIIEKVTPETVKIAGEYYMRETCEFKVR